MSFSVTKSEGTTVFTMTSDPGTSSCPLICQILRLFCCPPTGHRSGKLRRPLGGTMSSLATVQIMVGLLTIGLGAVLLSLYDGSPWFITCINAPYWLGAIFIICGIFTIFGENFPGPCLAFLTGIVNIASAILAVVAIVFYAVDEGVPFGRMCVERDEYNNNYDYDYGNRYHSAMNLTDLGRKVKDHNLQLCRMYERTVLPVAMGVKVMLLVIAALQLCVSISVAVLAVKEMTKLSKDKKVPEVQQPLVEEVTANPVP